MRLTVNGSPEEHRVGLTVGELVEGRTEEHRRVAIALNGAVVPRSRWTSTGLADGDVVEVLVAVAGG